MFSGGGQDNNNVLSGSSISVSNGSNPIRTINNTLPKNPVPRLISFFNGAKPYKNDAAAALTSVDYTEIKFILENRHHVDFIGLSFSMLMQAIVYKNGTWANLRKQNLIDPMMDTISRLYYGLMPRDVAMIFRSFSQLKIDNQDDRDYISDLLVKAIHRNITAFNDVDLSVIFLTLVSLDFNWDHIKKNNLDVSLLKAVKTNVAGFNKIVVSNIVWSLARLDAPWETLKAIGLDKDLLKCAEKFIPSAEETLLTQIQLAKLWYDFEFDADTQAIFEEKLSKMSKPKSSEFHNRIAKLISKLTAEPFENEKVYGFVLFVDVGFGKKGFEINGPCHEDGESRDNFKIALLTKLNVSVEFIDYKDKITLDYLKAKLIKLGIKLKEPKPRPVYQVSDEISSAKQENSSEWTVVGRGRSNRSALKEEEMIEDENQVFDADNMYALIESIEEGDSNGDTSAPLVDTPIGPVKQLEVSGGKEDQAAADPIEIQTEIKEIASQGPGDNEIQSKNQQKELLTVGTVSAAATKRKAKKEKMKAEKSEHAEQKIEPFEKNEKIEKNEKTAKAKKVEKQSNSQNSANKNCKRFGLGLFATGVVVVAAVGYQYISQLHNKSFRL